MDAAALLVLIELINAATGAMTALQGVSKVIQQARDEGRDVTLDDLKALELKDDESRQVLVDAIENAEDA